MRQFRRFLPLLMLCLLLCGCGTAEKPQSTSVPLSRAPVADLSPETGPPSTAAYTTPPFADSGFHEELAEGSDGALIDLSAVREGYVAVSAKSEKRLKFQVLKGEETYNYNLASDGTPSVFPLQCGNGNYMFRIMENISESRYAMLYGTSCDVTLLDEFQPFLRPSDYAPYTPDSACVKKAAELASDCGTALEIVGAVYDFICGTVRYDTQKAMSVQTGYLPDPDETMETGMGICFDYASLAAAMLRSQGIPTKLIFGYVAPNDLYHAWNMFYTEESGWVTVSFEVRGDTWARMDLTFSAGGASTAFVGDGSNYADLYTY